METDNLKTDFIDFMMSCGVLSFGDFTLKSGRRSPYFINTGKYRTGAQLSKLGDFYSACLAGSVALSGRTLLFGPAYKGITLAAAAASSLWRNNGIDVRYAYNRKEAKDHGEGGGFVGAPICGGDEVVIIEDVVTAGTALREVLPLLHAAADITVRDMIISVDRMELTDSGKTAVEAIYDEFGIKVHSIVTVADIAERVRDTLEPELYAGMTAYMSEHCGISPTA